ncbi:MAG: hypothetical protein NVV63_12730 [Opitutus sp.]|nr:hypothetical protein [Opitutus sp.]
MKGTLAISRFLGVSEDTFRRRFAKQIPICGYETFNHRGKINVRPICRRDELTAFRENLPQSSRRTRLTTQPA